MQTNKYTLVDRREKRQLLIENKLTFDGPESELSIYDTYRAVSRIGLNAPQLMYCGMVKGKKIMHSFGAEKGEVFLPHESFVMPPGGYVEIDFPEANEKQPTTCLTIEIPPERINSVAEKMRDITRLDALDHDWQYSPQVIHNHHTLETQKLLERLVLLFTRNHPDKEIMIELGISELIIRLLREQGRGKLLQYCQSQPDSSGITAAIYYIENNLETHIDTDFLCKLACMSRSKFYLEFKKQLGCTPGEFQQQLRLKRAAKEITQGKRITDICFNLGYSDLAHFSRRFKQFFGCSPRQYRMRYQAGLS